MILSRAQSRRLNKIFDAIEAFAVDRYRMYEPEEAAMFTMGGTLDQLASAALSRFWEDPSSIDAFLARCSKGLTAAEIADIKAFSDRICGTALMVGIDSMGRGLFSVELRTVAVTGILTPMAELLPGPYPKPVDINLLPYDGVVTYDGFISEFPMQMGPGLRIALNAEMKEALSRAPITEAGEFADFARAVAWKRIEDDERRFAEQLKRDEWDAKGNEPLPPDVRRGVLAGLSESERDELIRKDMEANRAKAGQAGAGSFDPVARLKKLAVKGEPQLAFADSLTADTKSVLSGYAVELGVRNFSKLRKQELAELVAPELLRDAARMESDLLACRRDALDLAKALVECGTIHFTSAQALASCARYVPVEPWTRLYWTQGEFVLAMPDEVRELGATLDLDDILARRERLGRVEHLGEVLTELCGVVSLADFCDWYRELYGTAETDGEICNELVRLRNMHGSDLSFSFWVDPNEPEETRLPYLIDYRLSNEYLTQSFANSLVRQKGPVDVEALLANGSFSPYEKKFLAELKERDLELRYLLERHEQAASAGRVKLDPVLRDKDVLEWKSSLPAVVNLRNWLDAHVPEDENDLYFSEKVIEELIDARTMAPSPKDFIQDASELGLLMLTEDPETIVGRLMAFWNGLPDWECDGWSPDALADKRSGKKTFRNPDGTPMKVGRNDPCPCGSGKKYKRCCGR